jgi:uncharacterized membrane protein
VNLLLLVMRLLHVVLGAFWVGTMLFVTFFLFPAIRDAGPDGAKIAAGVNRRGFLVVMPVVAGLTILSGLWLYWRLSGGFQPTFMHSGTGITFGLGAAAAIAAYVIGVAVVRPAMTRATALAESAAKAPAAERDAHLLAAQGLRARAASAGQIVAVLLLLAVAAMALARYV